MKKLIVAVVFLAAFLLLTVSGCEKKPETRLWSNLCSSCHNSKTAPTAKTIRNKYRTTEEFAAAVKASGHRCINILKSDDSLIRKVAHEIGLKGGT